MEKLKCISLFDYTMLLSDVKTLFSLIPIQKALDNLKKKLYEFRCFAVETEEILNLDHMYDTNL